MVCGQEGFGDCGGDGGVGDRRDGSKYGGPMSLRLTKGTAVPRRDHGSSNELFGRVWAPTFFAFCYQPSWRTPSSLNITSATHSHLDLGCSSSLPSPIYKTQSVGPNTQQPVPSRLISPAVASGNIASCRIVGMSGKYRLMPGQWRRRFLRENCKGRTLHW